MVLFPRFCIEREDFYFGYSIDPVRKKYWSVTVIAKQNVENRSHRKTRDRVTWDLIIKRSCLVDK